MPIPLNIPEKIPQNEAVPFVIYENNMGNITNAKKRGANFIKMVERHGQNALFFEQSLEIDSHGAEKVRRTLERLYATIRKHQQ